MEKPRPWDLTPCDLFMMYHDPRKMSQQAGLDTPGKWHVSGDSSLWSNDVKRKQSKGDWLFPFMVRKFPRDYCCSRWCLCMRNWRHLLTVANSRGRLFWNHCLVQLWVRWRVLVKGWKRYKDHLDNHQENCKSELWLSNKSCVDLHGELLFQAIVTNSQSSSEIVLLSWVFFFFRIC